MLQLSCGLFVDTRIPNESKMNTSSSRWLQERVNKLCDDAQGGCMKYIYVCARVSNTIYLRSRGMFRVYCWNVI